VLLGRSLSGKTTVAKFLVEKCGFSLINIKAIEEDLKKRLSTEDNEVEEIPLDVVDKEIIRLIQADK
jgi:adenylate kinase family enzyme